MGDHIDYYCLQLEKFHSDSIVENRWVFGPEEDLLINEARSRVASIGKAEKCFNARVSGLEESVAAFIWAIHINGRFVSGAQIILYHKPSNRILYVSFET